MREKVGVLDSYYLKKALKGSASKLGERCGSAAVEMLSKRLALCIGTPNDDQYSYIWRSAIEDHEQDKYKDSFRTVLVDALRDAALGFADKLSDDAIASTRGLLLSPYPTLVRIGIYVCGERYGNVGEAFWTCLKPEWLVEVACWHELFWFIKKAFPRFSAPERKRYLTLIDEAQGDWVNEPDREEWDECHRRDLLYPAVGYGDAEVDAKYQRLVERRGSVPEYPDFHTYSTSGGVIVGERSPVASDKLIGMSDEELLTLLRDFVPDTKAWDGPTYRGFASTLSSAVRASEDGFASRIKMFADVARPYQHGLLRGLKERWADDKHDIDWDEALSFMRTVAESPAFQTDLDAEATEGWEPSVREVVTDFADLIKAGSSTERPIALAMHSKCIEILKIVLSATKPTEASESKDAVSHVLNSPRGRTLEALINIALAMRRHEVASQQGEGFMWVAVGPILDGELVSCESGQNADFAALAGMYCSNLHYLNSQWVEDNFDRLFSTSNESAWKCAAQGFAYQRHLYSWLYKRLIEGGHLPRMIYTDGLPDSVAEKALQFLGLAYLEGMEEIDDGGLMSGLVVGLKTEQLSKLCWFFWTLRGSQERSVSRVPRILEFWRRIAAAIRDSGTPQPELQSALNDLAVFIDKITPDTMRMWAEAAPHAQVRHHGYILVEHLARLAGTYPSEVATVFKAALSGFLPDYRREDVIRCVMQLAEAGRVEDAEWICNEYARQSSTMLKDTYEMLRAAQRSRRVTG